MIEISKSDVWQTAVCSERAFADVTDWPNGSGFVLHVQSGVRPDSEYAGTPRSFSLDDDEMQLLLRAIHEHGIRLKIEPTTAASD